MDERAQRLAQALSATLDAIELHDTGPDKRSFACPAVSEPMSLDQVEQLHRLGEFMLADPIGYGLRKTVRKIGKVIARDFPQHMHEIAEQAADVAYETEEPRYANRSVIIDKNWDGLEIAGGGVWFA